MGRWVSGRCSVGRWVNWSVGLIKPDSESLSLNGDHIKSIASQARRTCNLWEHIFLSELFE